MSLYLNGKNITGESNNNANKDLSNLSSTGQAKFNAKQNTVTGGASTITSSNLTVSRALISNTSGKVAVSTITSTELSYLDGVTSNIQTQLDSKLNSSVITSYYAPDYNSAVEIANNQQFTSTINGYVSVYSDYANNGEPVASITINGMTFTQKNYRRIAHIIMPISIGDIVTPSATGNTITIRRIPLKEKAR